MVVVVTISAENVNAQQSAWVYGAPGPWTSIMFARALCGNANVTLNEKSGIYYCLQNVAPNGTYHRMRGEFDFSQIKSAQRDIAPKGKRSGGTQVDLPKVKLDARIAFEIKDGVRDPIEKAMETMRFGGGRIKKYYIATYDGWDSRMTHGGWTAVVPPEPEYMVSDGTVDNLLSLLSKKRESGGMIAPSMLGLRLLSEPTEKSGARMGKRHAFADVLVGTVLYERATAENMEKRWCVREDRENLTMKVVQAQQ